LNCGIVIEKSNMLILIQKISFFSPYAMIKFYSIAEMAGYLVRQKGDGNCDYMILLNDKMVLPDIRSSE